MKTKCRVMEAISGASYRCLFESARANPEAPLPHAGRRDALQIAVLSPVRQVEAIDDRRDRLDAMKLRVAAALPGFAGSGCGFGA